MATIDNEELTDCHGDEDEPDEMDTTDVLVDGTDALGRRVKAKRWNIPSNVLQSLEQAFETDKHPTMDARKQMAAEMNVTLRQVQVWFQNKRRPVKPTTTECSRDSGLNPGVNPNPNPDISG